MKLLSTILTIVSGIITLIFSYIFYIRLTFNYNEEGNYFDENASVIYHQQSVMVYGLATLLSLIVTIVLVCAGRRLTKINQEI